MPVRLLEESRRTPIGHRPTRADAELARLVLAPWRWITAPRVSGLEHVPAGRPVLLAGNHTTWALLDSPLLLLELYEACGVFPRTVGDHLHFRVPGWRALVERFGVVDGTPENLRALMRAGEWIVVFPGGAREVFKRRGEKYTLVWGERAGFARLAIECGYPIVPFSLVGAEDALDILLDADDLLASPLGPLLRRLAPRADFVPPLVRGVGPTAIPRAERFYFHFGEPVETRHLAGRERDHRTCFAVRERVQKAIEDGIVRLLLERERDPDRALLARVLAPHGRMTAREVAAGETTGEKCRAPGPDDRGPCWPARPHVGARSRRGIRAPDPRAPVSPAALTSTNGRRRPSQALRTLCGEPRRGASRRRAPRPARRDRPPSACARAS